MKSSKKDKKPRIWLPIIDKAFSNKVKKDFLIEKGIDVKKTKSNGSNFEEQIKSDEKNIDSEILGLKKDVKKDVDYQEKLFKNCFPRVNDNKLSAISKDNKMADELKQQGISFDVDLLFEKKLKILNKQTIKYLSLEKDILLEIAKIYCSKDEVKNFESTNISKSNNDEIKGFICSKGVDEDYINNIIDLRLQERYSRILDDAKSFVNKITVKNTESLNDDVGFVLFNNLQTLIICDRIINNNNKNDLIKNILEVKTKVLDSAGYEDNVGNEENFNQWLDDKLSNIPTERHKQYLQSICQTCGTNLQQYEVSDVKNAFNNYNFKDRSVKRMLNVAHYNAIRRVYCQISGTQGNKYDTCIFKLNDDQIIDLVEHQDEQVEDFNGFDKNNKWKPKIKTKTVKELNDDAFCQIMLLKPKDVANKTYIQENFIKIGKDKVKSIIKNHDNKNKFSNEMQTMLKSIFENKPFVNTIQQTLNINYYFNKLTDDQDNEQNDNSSIQKKLKSVFIETLNKNDFITAMINIAVKTEDEVVKLSDKSKLSDFKKKIKKEILQEIEANTDKNPFLIIADGILNNKKNKDNQSMISDLFDNKKNNKEEKIVNEEDYNTFMRCTIDGCRDAFDIENIYDTPENKNKKTNAYKINTILRILFKLQNFNYNDMENEIKTKYKDIDGLIREAFNLEKQKIENRQDENYEITEHLSNEDINEIKIIIQKFVNISKTMKKNFDNLKEEKINKICNNYKTLSKRLNITEKLNSETPSFDTKAYEEVLANVMSELRAVYGDKESIKIISCGYEKNIFKVQVVVGDKYEFTMRLKDETIKSVKDELEKVKKLISSFKDIDVKEKVNLDEYGSVFKLRKKNYNEIHKILTEYTKETDRAIEKCINNIQDEKTLLKVKYIIRNSINNFKNTTRDFFTTCTDVGALKKDIDYYLSTLCVNTLGDDYVPVIDEGYCKNKKDIEYIKDAIKEELNVFIKVLQAQKKVMDCKEDYIESLKAKQELYDERIKNLNEGKTYSLAVANTTSANRQEAKDELQHFQVFKNARLVLPEDNGALIFLEKLMLNAYGDQYLKTDVIRNNNYITVFNNENIPAIAVLKSMDRNKINEKFIDNKKYSLLTCEDIKKIDDIFFDKNDKDKEQKRTKLLSMLTNTNYAGRIENSLDAFSVEERIKDESFKTYDQVLDHILVLIFTFLPEESEDKKFIDNIKQCIKKKYNNKKIDIKQKQELVDLFYRIYGKNYYELQLNSKDIAQKYKEQFENKLKQLSSDNTKNILFDKFEDYIKILENGCKILYNYDIKAKREKLIEKNKEFAKNNNVNNYNTEYLFDLSRTNIIGDFFDKNGFDIEKIVSFKRDFDSTAEALGAKPYDSFEEKFKKISNALVSLFNYLKQNHINVSKLNEMITKTDYILQDNNELNLVHKKLCKLLFGIDSKKVDQYFKEYKIIHKKLEKPDIASNEDKKRWAENGRIDYYNKQYQINSAILLSLGEEQLKFYSNNYMENANGFWKKPERQFTRGEELSDKIRQLYSIYSQEFEKQGKFNTINTPYIVWDNSKKNNQNNTEFNNMNPMMNPMANNGNYNNFPADWNTFSKHILNMQNNNNNNCLDVSQMQQKSCFLNQTSNDYKYFNKMNNSKFDNKDELLDNKMIENCYTNSFLKNVIDYNKNQTNNNINTNSNNVNNNNNSGITLDLCVNNKNVTDTSVVIEFANKNDKRKEDKQLNKMSFDYKQYNEVYLNNKIKECDKNNSNGSYLKSNDIDLERVMFISNKLSSLADRSHNNINPLCDFITEDCLSSILLSTIIEDDHANNRMYKLCFKKKDKNGRHFGEEFYPNINALLFGTKEEQDAERTRIQDFLILKENEPLDFTIDIMIGKILLFDLDFVSFEIGGERYSQYGVPDWIDGFEDKNAQAILKKVKKMTAISALYLCLLLKYRVETAQLNKDKIVTAEELKESLNKVILLNCNNITKIIKAYKYFNTNDKDESCSVKFSVGDCFYRDPRYENKHTIMNLGQKSPEFFELKYSKNMSKEYKECIQLLKEQIEQFVLFRDNQINNFMNWYNLIKESEEEKIRGGVGIEQWYKKNKDKIDIISIDNGSKIIKCIKDDNNKYYQLKNDGSIDHKILDDEKDPFYEQNQSDTQSEDETEYDDYFDYKKNQEEQKSQKTNIPMFNETLNVVVGKLPEIKTKQQDEFYKLTIDGTEYNIAEALDEVSQSDVYFYKNQKGEIVKFSKSMQEKVIEQKNIAMQELYKKSRIKINDNGRELTIVRFSNKDFYSEDGGKTFKPADQYGSQIANKRISVCGEKQEDVKFKITRQNDEFIFCYIDNELFLYTNNGAIVKETDRFKKEFELIEKLKKQSLSEIQLRSEKLLYQNNEIEYKNFSSNGVNYIINETNTNGKREVIFKDCSNNMDQLLERATKNNKITYIDKTQQPLVNITFVKLFGNTYFKNNNSKEKNNCFKELKIENSNEIQLFKQSQQYIDDRDLDIDSNLNIIKLKNKHNEKYLFFKKDINGVKTITQTTNEELNNFIENEAIIFKNKKYIKMFDKIYELGDKLHEFKNKKEDINFLFNSKQEECKTKNDKKNTSIILLEKIKNKIKNDNFNNFKNNFNILKEAYKDIIFLLGDNKAKEEVKQKLNQLPNDFKEKLVSIIKQDLSNFINYICNNVSGFVITCHNGTAKNCNIGINKVNNEQLKQPDFVNFQGENVSIIDVLTSLKNNILSTQNYQAETVDDINRFVCVLLCFFTNNSNIICNNIAGFGDNTDNGNGFDFSNTDRTKERLDKIINLLKLNKEIIDTLQVEEQKQDKKSNNNNSVLGNNQNSAFTDEDKEIIASFKKQKIIRQIDDKISVFDKETDERKINELITKTFVQQNQNNNNNFFMNNNNNQDFITSISNETFIDLQQYRQDVSKDKIETQIITDGVRFYKKYNNYINQLTEEDFKIFKNDKNIKKYVNENGTYFILCEKIVKKNKDFDILFNEGEKKEIQKTIKDCNDFTNSEDNKYEFKTELIGNNNNKIKITKKTLKRDENYDKDDDDFSLLIEDVKNNKKMIFNKKDREISYQLFNKKEFKFDNFVNENKFDTYIDDENKYCFIKNNNLTISEDGKIKISDNICNTINYLKEDKKNWQDIELTNDVQENNNQQNDVIKINQNNNLFYSKKEKQGNTEYKKLSNIELYNIICKAKKAVVNNEEETVYCHMNNKGKTCLMKFSKYSYHVLNNKDKYLVSLSLKKQIEKTGKGSITLKTKYKNKTLEFIKNIANDDNSYFGYIKETNNIDKPVIKPISTNQIINNLNKDEYVKINDNILSKDFILDVKNDKIIDNNKQKLFKTLLECKNSKDSDKNKLFLIENKVYKKGYNDDYISLKNEDIASIKNKQKEEVYNINGKTFVKIKIENKDVVYNENDKTNKDFDTEGIKIETKEVFVKNDKDGDIKNDVKIYKTTIKNKGEEETLYLYKTGDSNEYNNIDNSVRKYLLDEKDEDTYVIFEPNVNLKGKQIKGEKKYTKYIIGRTKINNDYIDDTKEYKRFYIYNEGCSQVNQVKSSDINRFDGLFDENGRYNNKIKPISQDNFGEKQYQLIQPNVSLERYYIKDGNTFTCIKNKKEYIKFIKEKKVEYEKQEKEKQKEELERDIVYKSQKHIKYAEEDYRKLKELNNKIIEKQEEYKKFLQEQKIKEREEQIKILKEEEERKRIKFEEQIRILKEEEERKRIKLEEQIELKKQEKEKQKKEFDRYIVHNEQRKNKYNEECKKYSNEIDELNNKIIENQKEYKTILQEQKKKYEEKDNGLKEHIEKEKIEIDNQKEQKKKEIIEQIIKEKEEKDNGLKEHIEKEKIIKNTKEYSSELEEINKKEEKEKEEKERIEKENKLKKEEHERIKREREQKEKEIKEQIKKESKQEVERKLQEIDNKIKQEKINIENYNKIEQEKVKDRIKEAHERRKRIMQMQENRLFGNKNVGKKYKLKTTKGQNNKIEEGVKPENENSIQQIQESMLFKKINNGKKYKLKTTKVQNETFKINNNKPSYNNRLPSIYKNNIYNNRNYEVEHNLPNIYSNNLPNINQNKPQYNNQKDIFSKQQKGKTKIYLASNKNRKKINYKINNDYKETQMIYDQYKNW